MLMLDQTVIKQVCRGTSHEVVTKARDALSSSASANTFPSRLEPTRASDAIPVFVSFHLTVPVIELMLYFSQESNENVNCKTRLNEWRIVRRAPN